jgi:hypothetical protein
MTTGAKYSNSGQVLRVQPVPPESASRQDVVTLALAGIVGTLANGFLLMVALGAAHRVWPQVPAAGYLDSVLMCFGLSAVGSMVRGSRRWWFR